MESISLAHREFIACLILEQRCVFKYFSVLTKILLALCRAVEFGYKNLDFLGFEKPKNL